MERTITLEEFLRRVRIDARRQGRSTWDLENALRAIRRRLGSDQAGEARSLQRALRRQRVKEERPAAVPTPTLRAASLFDRLRPLRALTPEQILGEVRTLFEEEALGSEPGQPLARSLSREVVGQPEAMAAIADHLAVSGAGLRLGDRCRAVLLFAGEPGTGKTYTAQVLARLLLGSEERLVRLDMSEYMERHSAARLVGSPPGYVGYEEGGQLTAAVLRDPRCLVLLDEIEKAHPEVLDTFLQVFSGARLTDSRGRVVRFGETTFLMTTNLACDPAAADDVGLRQRAPQPASQRAIEAALRRRFRPELLDRVDRVIRFQPLGPEALREIVRRDLGALRETARDQHQLELVVDEEVASRIMEAVTALPSPGAREARRQVERLVAVPLAEWLAHHPAHGGVVSVRIRGEEEDHARGLVVETRRVA